MAGYYPYPGHSLVIMGEWAYKNVYGSEPGFKQTPAWWASWLANSRWNSNIGPKIKQLIAAKKSVSGPMGAVMEVLTSNLGSRIYEVLTTSQNQAGPGEVAHTTLLVNNPGSGQMSGTQYYGLTRKATEWAAKAVANRQVSIGYLDLVIVNMGLQELYSRRLPIWQNPAGANPTRDEIISWTAFLKSTHWAGPGSVISWYSDYSTAAWEAQSAAYEQYDKFLGVVETTLKYASLQAPADKAMELVREFFQIKAKIDTALNGTKKILDEYPNAASPDQMAVYQQSKQGVSAVYDDAAAVLQPVGLWEPSTSLEGDGLGAVAAVVLGIKAAVWITIAGAAAFIVYRVTQYLSVVEENNNEISQQAMAFQENRLSALDSEYARRQQDIAKKLASGALTKDQADAEKQNLFAWYNDAAEEIAEKAQEIQENKVESSSPFAAGMVAVAALAGLGLVGYFVTKS